MADRPDSACPGYCCAAFYWPRTITEQRRRAAETYDGEQIADMLVRLTPKQARERYEKFSGKQSGLHYSWKHRGHYFTCKNWDEDTRLCKIYEDRPAMCRDFPYGTECPHGCGFCGGLASEERAKIRSEQWTNEWKAYMAAKGTDKHV